MSPRIDPDMIKLLKPWELVLVVICIVILIIFIPPAVKTPLTVVVNCKDGQTVIMKSKDFDPESFNDYCDM